MGAVIAHAEGNPCMFKSAAKVPFENLKVYFAPVQSGSGDPSPTNVRPISGWTGVNVTHWGGNLMNNVVQNMANAGGKVAVKSTYRAMYCEIPGPGDYTISRDSVSGNRFVIYVTVEEPATGVVLHKDWSYDYDELSRTITVPDGYHYIFIYLANDDSTITSHIKVERGSSVQNNLTYPVSWENDAGTVYGGYVDLVNGVLTVTTKTYTIDGNTTFASDFFTESNRVRFCTSHGSSTPYNDMKYGNTERSVVYASNMGVGDNGGSDSAPTPCVTAGWSHEQFYIALPLSYGVTSRDEAITWVTNNPIMVAYKLKTPMTYQLTTQQISTLLGRNNIWSNAGEKVEADYQFVEAEEIIKRKQKILMNDPELPPHYQRVEYIESSGTQYIKTDYVPTADYTDITIDFMFTSSQTGDAMLFGSYGGKSTTKTWQCECYNNTSWFVACGLYRYARAFQGLYNSLNVKYTLHIDNVSLSINGNSITDSATRPDNNPYPMYIFAWNNKGSTQYINTGSRIYSLIFKENGIVAAKFIPCYRIVDGEIGMYDVIAKKFYTNAGTGTFSKGARI